MKAVLSLVSLLTLCTSATSQDLAALFCAKDCLPEVCFADAIDYADVVVEARVLSTRNVTESGTPVLESTLRVSTIFKGADYLVTDTIVSVLNASRLRMQYYIEGKKQYARAYPGMVVCGTQLWQASKSLSIKVPTRDYVEFPMIGIYLFKLRDGSLDPMLVASPLTYAVDRNLQFQRHLIAGTRPDAVTFSTPTELYRFLTEVTGLRPSWLEPLRITKAPISQKRNGR